MKETISQRFAAVHWHDSQIKSINIDQRADREFEVIFDIIAVKFRDEKRVRLKLRFAECHAIRADLNLMFLSACDGSIISATYVYEIASLNSDQKRQLGSLLAEDKSFSRTGWFLFEMDPPGGTILIGASDFEVCGY